jgi:hypothetical protein
MPHIDSWRTTLFAYVNGAGTNITDPNKFTVDAKVVYVEPTNIASNASVTNIQTTSMTINIGNKGAGQNIMILAKKVPNPLMCLLMVKFSIHLLHTIMLKYYLIAAELYMMAKVIHLN